MMRERVELGFQSGEMRDASAFSAKSLPEIKSQKMAEQTNDVLSFLINLKKTYTLPAIQGQQLARTLPSLSNEKANKIYSRLDMDTCRSYDTVKTKVLKCFRLSPKAAYLQKLGTMTCYSDDSYLQFLHQLKYVQNYYLESKQITEFQLLSDDMLIEQIKVSYQVKLAYLWISVMLLRLRRWRNSLI